MTTNEELRPVPGSSALTEPYWQAAREHRLVIQRCDGCSRYQHPPASLCQNCRSSALSWAGVSGNGTIYEYTTVEAARIAGFEGTTYVCITVELVEQPGLFMLTNYFAPCTNQPSVGQQVSLVWEDIRDGFSLPQFAPVEPGAQS